MTDLIVRLTPGDQKQLAVTIFNGEEYYGQGGTIDDALMDLGLQLKEAENEIRVDRQQQQHSRYFRSVSSNPGW